MTKHFKHLKTFYEHSTGVSISMFLTSSKSSLLIQNRRVLPSTKTTILGAQKVKSLLKKEKIVNYVTQQAFTGAMKGRNLQDMRFELISFQSHGSLQGGQTGENSLQKGCEYWTKSCLKNDICILQEGSKNYDCCI